MNTDYALIQEFNRAVRTRLGQLRNQIKSPVEKRPPQEYKSANRSLDRGFSSTSAEMTVSDENGGAGMTVQVDNTRGQPVLYFLTSQGKRFGLTDLDILTAVTGERPASWAMPIIRSAEDMTCFHCGVPITFSPEQMADHDVALATCQSGHPLAIVRKHDGFLAATLSSSTSGSPTVLDEKTIENMRHGIITGRDSHTGQLFLYLVEHLKYQIPITSRPNIAEIPASPYKAKYSGGYIEISPQGHTNTETIVVGPDPDKVTRQNFDQYVTLAAAAIFLKEQFAGATKGRRWHKVSGINTDAFIKKVGARAPFDDDGSPYDMHLIVLDPDPEFDPSKILETRAGQFETRGLRVFSVHDQKIAGKHADLAEKMGYIVPADNFGIIHNPFDDAERIIVFANHCLRSSIEFAEGLRGNLRVMLFDGQQPRPYNIVRWSSTTNQNQKYLAFNSSNPAFVTGAWETKNGHIPVFQASYYNNKKRWDAETGEVRPMTVIDLR